MNPVDLSLAQRLSASWDCAEVAATFKAETSYDVLRRDTCTAFLGLMAEGVPGAKVVHIDNLRKIYSLVQRLNAWKKDSTGAECNVSDRAKGGLTQLSSLANFPLHLGLAGLEKTSNKAKAALPIDLEMNVASRDAHKLKESLKATKFLEISECIKDMAPPWVSQLSTPRPPQKKTNKINNK